MNCPKCGSEEAVEVDYPKEIFCYRCKVYEQQAEIKSLNLRITALKADFDGIMKDNDRLSELLRRIGAEALTHDQGNGIILSRWGEIAAIAAERRKK